MNDQPHLHDKTPTSGPLPPETPVDTGSQALAEALSSSFAIVKFVMIVLVVVFLASGFFTVQEQERAIILRFGKPVGEGQKALLGPGLHWSYPYPIDEFKKVSVTGIQKVNSAAGWYATTPEQELAGTEPPAGGNSLNPAVDGYALTADGNIIHTRATLLYRIEYPIQYVFGFVNASNAVQNALDNALLQTAAHFRVDDILTRDVAGFRESVKRRVTELLDRQKAGVAVEDCIVQSIPPRQLKAAFDNVVKAGVTRNKVLNEARSHENQVLTGASADAQSLVNVAESERAILVKDIAGQSERFNDILPQYRQNPRLFVQQRLAETFGLALANVEKWVLPTTVNGKSTEVRLLLNREPPVPKTDAPTRP
jgi:membrane protease subunit HflK